MAVVWAVRQHRAHLRRPRVLLSLLAFALMIPAAGCAPIWTGPEPEIKVPPALVGGDRPFVVEATTVITNPSDEPLDVAEVAPVLGYVTATVSPTKLAPRGEATLRVQFRWDFPEPADIRHTVPVVLIGKREHLLRYTFRVRAAPRLSIAPRSLNLGTVPLSTELQAQVRVVIREQAHRRPSLRVTAARSLSNRVSVVLGKPRRTGRWHAFVEWTTPVNVLVRTGPTPGSRSDTISITFSRPVRLTHWDSPSRHVYVRVSWHAIAPWRAKPRAAVLIPGRHVDIELLSANRDSRPPVRSVVVDRQPPGLLVERSLSDTPPRVRLTWSPAPESARSDQLVQVVFRLDHPRQPTVSATVLLRGVISETHQRGSRTGQSGTAP